MDEKYFEAFKRNLLVPATTHGCEEILEGDYEPGYDDDSQALFQQKQYFMYSVFSKVLQSDMGKTIVRKYAPTLDAQAQGRVVKPPGHELFPCDLAKVLGK